MLVGTFYSSLSVVRIPTCHEKKYKRVSEKKAKEKRKAFTPLRRN